jgi:hypothetical protein
MLFRDIALALGSVSTGAASPLVCGSRASRIRGDRPFPVLAVVNGPGFSITDEAAGTGYTLGR